MLTEELASGSLAIIRVGDLTAVQEIVIVTRRGGFLSAASSSVCSRCCAPTMASGDGHGRRPLPR